MIIHILKLIRSRMGGSGWILAELLVVFVVIWFMTSYFLMMGKSWYEPVGYDLEGVYHAVLAVRPSNSPSFVTYEEGGDEAARDVERIVERLGRTYPLADALRKQLLLLHVDQLVLQGR